MATDMIARAIAMSKADLVDGKVPESELPSYVDDVIEYSSTSAFPAEGERGKIYIALDTNTSYRWSGSTYIAITGQADWNQSDNTAPDFIKNKPTIPAAQVNSDWSAASGVAQILNKPTLGTAASKGVDSTPTASSTNLVESGGVEAALAEKADKSIVGLKLVAFNTMGSSTAFTYAMNKNDFIESSPDLSRSVGTYIISIMPWSTSPTYSLYAVSYTGGAFNYTAITKIAGADMSVTVENGVISVSGLPSTGGKISIHALL